MGKLIVEEKEIIPEEKYQIIKEKIGKKENLFTKQEFEDFNAIFNATPQIFVNMQKYIKIKNAYFKPI